MDENGLVLKRESKFSIFLKKYGGFILVLLILIAIIILSILSFPQLLSFVPKNELKDAKDSKSVDPTNTNVVAVSSQNKDYILLLDNSNLLRDYFSKLGIWGKSYNTKVQKNTRPLSVVLISLSDKKDQAYRVLDSKNKEIFSYSLVFNLDTLIMTIYLPDETLIGSNAEEVFGNAVGYAASVMRGSTFPKGVIPNNSEINKLFQITKQEQIGPTISLDDVKKIINSVESKK